MVTRGGENGAALASVAAPLANAVQIMVMNAAYKKIALTMNENENHETDTLFEDALISKLFVFEFANSFASFYYIAFIKGMIDDCYPSCMAELSLNLVIIFISKLVSSNANEVLKVRRALKKEKEREKIAAAPVWRVVLPSSHPTPPVPPPPPPRPASPFTSTRSNTSRSSG